MSLIAIPWYISNDLQKPGLYGSLLFIVTALTLFWGPYAGTLVDKHDRKKVMLSIQAVGLFIVAGIAFTAKYQNYTAIWMAAGVMIATKLIYNIHYPNLYAFAQEIVEKENYGKISSWIEVQGQTTFILSGALAAFLMEGKIGAFHFEPWPIYDIFLLDAATYVLGIFILWQISYESLVERKPDNTSFLNRTKQGFLYLKNHPLILLFGVVAGFVFASILVCSFLPCPFLLKM
ncbi:MAG: MFS transporter [Chitinophagales bacterium]|nr:MFS transporter [Chitinophagales bacterium]